MTMNESLKKYYDLLKNNWTIIALFPTAIGGLWQIIQLAKISVNMIRFFSISQLLSDGIIILLFFVFMILIISPIPIKILSNKSDDRKKKIPLYIFIAFNLLIITLYTFFYFNLSKYITIDKSLSLLMVYVILSCIIYSLSFLGKKWIKEYILIVFVILYFIIGTSITIIALSSITKNFDGIDNFNTLITAIEKKDCYSKKPNILYFNDKYIFIELEKKNIKSVLIKKIDDLFEE